MKITIRSWKPEDAAALASLLSNPNILKNLRDGIPFPYSESDALDYISAMTAADPDQIFAFAICQDQSVVGSITISRQDNIHRCTAELGYYVGEPYWGQGIATAAVRQICRKVFSCSDILRIYAEVFAGNAASCHVLEKAGFIREGILRRRAVKNGTVLDTHLYALVR